VETPEGTRSLERPRRRWVDNIKMGLSKVGRNGMDWTDLAQDKDRWRDYLKTLVNLCVP
jgi:hypothetical protein